MHVQVHNACADKHARTFERVHAAQTHLSQLGVKLANLLSLVLLARLKLCPFSHQHFALACSKAEGLGFRV